ncbi:hypothetical protein HETIRDRAFT_418736 [Heterobasidion irregulare TC 32-1]|uniref:Uncharacterized protein n=1 Tax=Heterobasidion irregulare (strain TC 32-1) TaxID=747525 RepID=W4K4W4_HETIT|nr:uncharacterized protein HETIRDRAFT_418736 [Heterobasidion irregulare TC 32-1]ETW80774.1 hypothetical protein HETIRDRAFT_418736 [Heterobasidion irregulare TC 32-1]
MPLSLVDLFVSALSNLIDVSPEYPAKLEDFMTWGQNFAHTLASLEAIPSFEPSLQLVIWLDSTKDTLETYVTNDWLAWGTQILQTRVMRRDKCIQAEVAAAQAKATHVAEVEACRLADEERVARGVAEEAHRRARDWEIMGLYESEHCLAKPLETESGPSMVSAKNWVVGCDGNVEMVAPILQMGDAIDSLRASTTALSIRGESLVPSRTRLFLPDGEEEVVELDQTEKWRKVVNEKRKGKHRTPPAWMSVKSLAKLPCTYCSHFVTPFVCFHVLGNATHCLKHHRDCKSCDRPRRWTKLLLTPLDTTPLPLPSSHPVPCIMRDLPASTSSAPSPPVASSSSACFLSSDLRQPARRLACVACSELRTRWMVDCNIKILHWWMARTGSEVHYLLSEHEARRNELAELECIRASLPEGSENEDEDGEGSVELVLN